MKKLVDSCVEGASVMAICVEGDKLIEAGTSVVYNKAVKGAKVPKGAPVSVHAPCRNVLTVKAI
jgi:hypothetical protein